MTVLVSYCKHLSYLQTENNNNRTIYLRYIFYI